MHGILCCVYKHDEIGRNEQALPLQLFRELLSSFSPLLPAMKIEEFHALLQQFHEEKRGALTKM